MSETSTVIVKRSMPIWTILFIILLTLKLTGTGVVASWSWWFVTAPIWAPLTFSLLFAAFMMLGMGFIALIMLLVAWLANRT